MHRYISFSLLFLCLISCAVMPPRRQYISELKKQVVPKEIFDTKWVLESYDHHPPDCSITISFLPKGQFVFYFKNKMYDSDGFWYMMKGSDTIDFHLHPLEKIAWTSDNCEMNPSHFAMYLEGDKKINVVNDR